MGQTDLEPRGGVSTLVPQPGSDDFRQPESGSQGKREDQVVAGVDRAGFE